MNKATLLTLPCLLGTLLAPALSSGEEFFLYTPKTAEGGPAPASPEEGVLCRKITIKRGDTLSGLSRKYLGRGSWYPQVLPFNTIKNPDLIYSGKKLLVPVPAGQATEVAEKAPAVAEQSAPVAEKKGAAKKRGKRVVVRHKGAAVPAKVEKAPAQTALPEIAPVEHSVPAVAKPERAPVQLPSAGESESYRLAKQAYLSGDYQKALELFSDFLSRYPNSVSSADAALYRADSMLHLAGQ